MSALAIILPFIWATEVPEGATEVPEALPPIPPKAPLEEVPREMAFYRKYTEGMLRLYMRMSMEAGKVSSLLGQDMFRAKVTSCRMESFDDVVIFIHDVDNCLKKLEKEHFQILTRISLQRNSVEETAELMHLKPKTVVRRYRQALDSLTRIFLTVKLLTPQKACQGGKIANFGSNY
jgi:hypothetical protein